MYYLDIIPAIQFLIGYWPFAPHLAYTLVRRYSTNNLENSQLANKDKQIYGEIHTADWSSIYNAAITLILLVTDITVLNKHMKDIAQWPVYLRIGNLSQEIRRS